MRKEVSAKLRSLAIASLTASYNEQCEKFPRTRELGLGLYVRRNLPAKLRNWKEALATYEFRLREEDRYLGSVFVTPMGQRNIEAKTQAAYQRCVALGMTHEHGL